MSIELKNVCVKGQETFRLEAVSTCFEDGSITVCIGKTGSGKSTLLDTIAGLVPIADGYVSVDNAPLWKGMKLDRQIALRLGSVFQYPENQLFARTVQGEFNYSLRPFRLSKTETRNRMIQSLSQVNLSDSIESLSPFTLSGGQKRRVALATTFAAKPDWLLLDEPSAGLDLSSTEQLCEFIRAFKSQNTMGGIIIATHDLDVFLPIADNVLLMQDGKVKRQVQTGELFAHPEWLTEIGIALPSTLAVHAMIRQLGGQLPAHHLSPIEMADVVYRQIACQEIQEHTQNPPQPLFSEGNIHPGPKRTYQSVHAKSESFSLDPRTKWLLCIFLSTAILLQSSWFGIFASICLTGLILSLSKISVSSIWRYSKSFIILIVLSMVLSALQFGTNAHIGVIHGFGLSWHPAIVTFKGLAGILCVVELGLLLSVTTSAAELKQALSQLLSPIQVRGLPIAAFTLSVSLLLRFIPIILEQLERFSRISRSRGKRNTKFGQISSHDLPAVVIPLLISLLKLGEELSLAMEARGYRNATQTVTHLRRLQMTRIDWIVLLCTGVTTILLTLVRFLSF